MSVRLLHSLHVGPANACLWLPLTETVTQYIRREQRVRFVEPMVGSMEAADPAD